jgi:hypothetical protein
MAEITWDIGHALSREDQHRKRRQRHFRSQCLFSYYFSGNRGAKFSKKFAPVATLLWRTKASNAIKRLYAGPLMPDRCAKVEATKTAKIEAEVGRMPLRAPKRTEPFCSFMSVLGRPGSTRGVLSSLRKWEAKFPKKWFASRPAERSSTGVLPTALPFVLPFQPLRGSLRAKPIHRQCKRSTLVEASGTPKQPTLAATNDQRSLITLS